MISLPTSIDGSKPSRLCLGSVPFGNTIDEHASFALLDRFIESGGNFIDTARIYSDWVPGEKRRSERILGDWLQARGHRHQLIIATKGAHPFIETPTTPRSSVAEIRDDLEGSLRTLRSDVIDIYWLHRDDVARPVEHFVDLLNTFAREGKIRAFGASNWSVARLRAAHDYAHASGQRGFDANQPLWCLGSAQARRPKDPGLTLLDPATYQFHLETGMPLVPYTSQANGFFSKLASSGQAPKAAAEMIDFDTPANLATAQVVFKIAQARDVAPSAIVLAYLWSRPLPVHPIVGCRTSAQLDECVAALPLRLTSQELRELEAASQSSLPVEIA